jgi:hypothetical protein
MKHLHIPYFLVQLILLWCWTSGLPLLASDLPKRKGLLVRVQRLQNGTPVAEAFFGGMMKVDGCRRWSKRGSPEWAPMLVTCSQVL